MSQRAHDHTSCADAIRSLPKNLIRCLILGPGRFWGFERNRRLQHFCEFGRRNCYDSVCLTWGSV
jgi:hypothetical protein